MAVPSRSTVSSKVVGACTGWKTASSAGVRSGADAGSTRAKVHCQAVEVRKERVVVETDRYRVEGMMTLPREGYRSRVSDHVNRRDQEFFTMVDCQLTSLDGSGRDWTTPVLMLARRHIRLIVPAPGEV
jgi:hypothetical protein